MTCFWIKNKYQQYNFGEFSFTTPSDKLLLIINNTIIIKIKLKYSFSKIILNRTRFN